ncbi:hypothetical protein D6821_02595, partial [Candidatus Parcubacteria bacterium]
MRQSFLFTKTAKELPKDETSFNAQALIRGGFIDKVAAGIYTFLPLGHRVHNKIINIIREEINKIGGQEILMPALTPKELWLKTERWDSFDVLFRLRGADEKEYALGATHEEVITPLVQKHTLSYKDLPVAVYQIQTKFRNELRAKAGLIRGREFSMKDLYSFHADEEDLSRYYKLTQKAYFKIYDRCGLLDYTYLTFASGGAFSKYSHEFQTITEAGEDIIHICDNCNLAVNEEIITEQKGCPHCGRDDLRAAKAVEVGNIFKLGTRFSRSFGFEYTDMHGNKKLPLMGCYGIGPSRVMATIVEVSHDDKGIIWPPEVAPFKVHLIELSGGNEEVKRRAEQLYLDLSDAGIEVLYDDRREIGAGQKFADADLIGCPFRLVVSAKSIEKNKAELKPRASKNLELVGLGDVIN